MPDDQGLERLFRREYTRLVHTVSVVVGSSDAAADAVQDAFVQASRHWARVRTYDDPARWLRRVAVNRALNQRRGRRRHDAALPRLVPLRAAVDDPLPAVDFDAALRRLPRQPIPTTPPPPQAALRAASCINTYSPLAVVALFYVADLPVAEIAEILGIADGTVKSHLHDARRALAPQLEVDDGHR